MSLKRPAADGEFRRVEFFVIRGRFRPGFLNHVGGFTEMVGIYEKEKMGVAI